MLIRSRTLTGLLFITLAGTSAAGAAPLASSTHQTEQDKARQEALAPQQQDFQSSQQRVAPQGIPFPEETHCKLINRVDIDSDNQALTRKLLAKTARQAQGRCLGSEGIRLLAYTLQNELIAQGYITSLIDVPSSRWSTAYSGSRCTMAKWALSTMPTARTPPACGIPYPPLPVLSCA